MKQDFSCESQKNRKIILMPRLMNAITDHSLSFEDIMNHCCLRSFCSNISLSCLVLVFSCVQLFATLWAVDRQALLFMGFFRQDCQSGFYFLLQELFPTQESNSRPPCLPHCRQILYLLSYWGKIIVAFYSLNTFTNAQHCKHRFWNTVI